MLFAKIFLLIVLVEVADCRPPKKDKKCPKDQPRVECFADPCEVTTCPATPDATCESNYCGGCHANFFNSDGEPACCGGQGQPCDTGHPIAYEDDCTCEGDLLCYPNEDDFTTGTCQTQEWVDANAEECLPCPSVKTIEKQEVQAITHQVKLIVNLSFR